MRKVTQNTYSMKPFMFLKTPCVCVYTHVYTLRHFKKSWEGNGKGLSLFILYICILFKGFITHDCLVIKNINLKMKQLYTYRQLSIISKIEC